jgi:hypothetical protein
VSVLRDTSVDLRATDLREIQIPVTNVNFLHDISPGVSNQFQNRERETPGGVSLRAFGSREEEFFFSGSEA